ncbi:DNA-protecting protein DprA [Lacticaseibacillus zeae]|uniref:DNA-protecting protein DprA n=1 Tax=Lacticaseibacillus zeae TaxID=57037 RepID=A0A5R8LRZ4_LACZE|nr:DNA-processing protein DprA [Lacticaseibacillus zeae]TLF40031.1 DNA-protecting protein DprA [Lacticaseibacillus zeae]
MRLRDFLLTWHLATHQNPRLAVALEKAIRAKADLTPFQCELDKKLTQSVAPILAVARQSSYVTYVDAAYPPRLREIPQPPLVFFYRGQIKLLRQLTLGVVGSRKATGYSAAALAQLFPQLPPMTIASGLAAGADSMAHEAALTAGLPTIAVIANGIDQVYPAKHRLLQERIGRVGLIVSEYPPGTAPQRFQFVARNRIIAGLAHGVMVTEAEIKSGSLITANYALQHNREVFALPNRFGERLGAGTNALIQAGGAIVTGPDTVIENLHYYP